jgi:selenocysteine lyase/cysteine desulfurase
LDEIGALCRNRNALFVVDAIQGLGTMPIDVDALGIDVLAADAHKFLYGPEAMTVLAYSEKARGSITPPWIGWWNVPWRESQLAYDLRPYETGRRFEPGSLPTDHVYALSAALDLLTEIGMEEAEARIGGIVDRLRSGLVDRGWQIRTPRGSRSAILSAAPPDGDVRAAVRKLEAEKIITSPRESAVRFAPHVGNDEEEIDRVLAATAPR